MVCGSPASAAAILTGQSAEIEDAWKSFEVPDAGGLYLEVRGTPDRAGFRVEQLLRARPIGEGASCATPVFDGDFVINGEEPFWAIEIRRDGIVFRSPEEPKGRKYPYAVTRTAGQPFYATRLTGPPASMLEIELKPKRCVDSMSGEIRSHEARVMLDGKLGAFETRFQVAGPLKQENGVYFATGNQQHQGGIDVAAFVADPESDTINVVLVENRKREDFKEGGRDVPLPAEVRTFLSELE